MIICPNCNHQNPEGSVQCESCYTPLPSTSPCPNCGAMVQTDATFCGQCGFNLQNKDTNIPVSASQSDPWDMEQEDIATELEPSTGQTAPTTLPVAGNQEPDAIEDPFVRESGNDQLEEIPANSEQEDLEAWLASMQDDSSSTAEMSSSQEIPDFLREETEISPTSIPEIELSEATANELEEPVAVESPEILPTSIPELELSEATANEPEELEVVESPEISPVVAEEVELTGNYNNEEPDSFESTPQVMEFVPESTVESGNEFAAVSQTPMGASAEDSSTRLQLQRAMLSHVQTDTNIEIPLNIAVVRIGKPNAQVPPDVDVSGFPNAEIVSRVHAEIRVEGDTYFIEDRGSSNGTYINHSPLLTGNRHRLRQGDRISLGKGDLMSFIFQVEQM